MNKKVLNLILISSLLFLGSCSKGETIYADAIYLNGNVITIDVKAPYAEAIATKAGLIIAVGSTEDISGLKGSSTRVIELNNNTIFPGFIDAHSHFAGVGTQALLPTYYLLPMVQ